MYISSYALFLLFSAEIMVFVKAQFAFTVDDTQVDDIYADIQAIWDDWANAGNQALESALTNYPDAWTQLTTIYGTDSVPTQFDPGLARVAANALAGVQQTTIWDVNINEYNQYSFEIRELKAESTDENNTADTTATLTTSIQSIGDDNAPSKDTAATSLVTSTTVEINSISNTETTSSSKSIFIPTAVIFGFLLIACVNLF